MKAGTTGGIEAILKAINTHITNANVCEQGCGALRSIVNDNGKILTKQATNKMKMNR